MTANLPQTPHPDNLMPYASDPDFDRLNPSGEPLWEPLDEEDWRTLDGEPADHRVTEERDFPHAHAADRDLHLSVPGAIITRSGRLPGGGWFLVGRIPPRAQARA